MKYSTRIKRKANGDTQIRITIDVTKAELEGVDRIADDLHCNIRTILDNDHEISLAYARTLCFWISLWNMHHNDKMKPLLTQCAKRRKSLNKRPKKKRKRG